MLVALIREASGPIRVDIAGSGTLSSWTQMPETRTQCQSNSALASWSIVHCPHVNNLIAAVDARTGFGRLTGRGNGGPLAN